MMENALQKIGEMERVQYKRQFLPFLPPSIGVPENPFHAEVHEYTVVKMLQLFVQTLP